MKKLIGLLCLVSFVVSVSADVIPGDYGVRILTLKDISNVCAVAVNNSTSLKLVSTRDIDGPCDKPIPTLDGGFVVLRIDGNILKYGPGYTFQAIKTIGFAPTNIGLVQVTRLSTGNVAVWREDGFRWILSSADLSEVVAVQTNGGKIQQMRPTHDGGYVCIREDSLVVKIDSNNNWVTSLSGLAMWNYGEIGVLSDGRVALYRNDGLRGIFDADLVQVGSYTSNEGAIQQMRPTHDGGYVFIRDDGRLVKIDSGNNFAAMTDALAMWNNGEIGVLEDGTVAVWRNSDGQRYLLNPTDLTMIDAKSAGPNNDIKQMVPTIDGGYAAIKADGNLNGVIVKVNSDNTSTTIALSNMWTNGEITGLIPPISTCADVMAYELGWVSDISGSAGLPDCKVNFYDFAAFALDWLECYDPVTSNCP